MKFKLLGLAAACAMGIHGVAQADYIPADSDYTIHLSGATASARFVFNGLIDRVCLTPAGGASDDITVYNVDGDDWNIICTVDTAAVPSASAGDVVMFVKQGGGSGDGTTPVLDPSNNLIDYQKAPLDATFVASTFCDAPVADTTGVGTPFSSHNNCGFSTVTLPGGDVGLSDVEPNLLFDVNTPSTGVVFNDVNNDMSIQALAALEFGIGATTQLRNALQAMQFDTGNICHPATTADAIQDTDNNGVFGNAGDVVFTGELVGNILLPAQITSGPAAGTEFSIGRVEAGTNNPAVEISPSLGTASVLDSEACMPSLSKTEIVGLFTGGITNWGQIIDESGNTLIDAANAANTAAGTTVVGVPTSHPALALNNQRVHVCRRNAGSGTNAQFQAIFLNRPCTSINGVFQSEGALASSPSTCSFTGSAVICMNRGSSDLGRCLNALENGALSGNNPELFNDSDANPTNNSRFAWGVGYQSLEKNDNLSRGWRFVKVQEVSPTLENAWRGDYFDVAESTCQWNSNENSVSFYIETQGIDPLETGSTGRIVPAGFKSDLGSFLCNAGPVDIFISNLNYVHPFGVGGWMTVPDADGFPGSDANAVLEAPTSPAALMDPNTPRPINTWTRGGKTCQPGKVVDDVSGLISLN